MLKDDEATHLICKPAQTQDVQFTTPEIELVFELAGCHPFFIQICCSHLFELKRENEARALSKANFDQVRRQFMVEAVDHFNYYLRHLNEKEKSLLHAVACLENYDPVTAGVISEAEALKRAGLIIQHNNQLRPFSTGFQNFLQSLPPISRVDIRQTPSIAQNLAYPADEGDYDGQVWDLIISLEKRLRILIKQILEAEWHDSPWEEQIQKRYPDLYEGWVNNKQKDSQTFRNYERADTIIFDYSYLDELGRIIEGEWNIFRSVFEFRLNQGKQNKQIIHQKIEEIARVRNPLAHGRTVPDTELRRAHVSCDDLNNHLDKWERRNRSQANGE
ncbi:MAG: hypothetical protein HS126_24435 [Anaerolineales bacterium]|nr:hypothetical protein [Anaerolineales bacterium]